MTIFIARKIALAKRWLLLLGVLIVAIAALSPFARSDGIGVNVVDQINGIGFNGGTAAPPPSCASPTAPNGVVDLSQCSNAFYVAIIF